MAICTLHLLALNRGKTLAALLSALRRAGIKPVSQARVLRWMILPRRISSGHLLARNIHWDALLILDDTAAASKEDGSIPASLRAEFIAAEWTTTVGTSAKLLTGYGASNAELLGLPWKPSVLDSTAGGDNLKEAASGSRNLELTPELASYISSLPQHLRRHPVSMLNLLSFNEGKHASYVKYGQEFTKRVGSRHGGKVKIVGKVVGSGFVEGQGEGDSGEGKGKEGWDEIAFVHYPSIAHFASMAGDADYQAVNREHRLGALKDTFIICVMEIGDDGEVVGRGALGSSGGAKL
ncbi:hypothetical protein F5Y16DRAFT_184419 [Xylariaceae sp. FL0255]|nr:hypothetical protein F5Y16DRAFT_184419 [Xylariaceae sp. FL0255]